MTENPMLEAFKQLRKAAEAQQASITEALLAEVTGKLVNWLGTVPSSLLPELSNQLDIAQRATETSTSPLAGMAAFFGQAPQVPTPTNGHTPAPGTMLGLGGATAAAADSAPEPQLAAHEADLLSAVRNLPQTRVFWWVQQIKDSKTLNSDETEGFTALTESFLNREFRVDSTGRPLAEQELARRNQELDRLREANKSLQQQVTDLQTKLTAASATPVTTPSADEVKLKGALQASRQLLAEMATRLNVGTNLPVGSRVRSEDLDALNTELTGEVRTKILAALNELMTKASSAGATPAPVNIGSFLDRIGAQDGIKMNRHRGETDEAYAKRVFTDAAWYWRTLTDITQTAMAQPFLFTEAELSNKSVIMIVRMLLSSNVEAAKAAKVALSRVNTSRMSNEVNGRQAVINELNRIISVASSPTNQ